MGERAAIERTKGAPATVPSLTDDLKLLGVTPGMVLLVHSSLSSLGWVCGGAVAVILALEQVLGSQGTLVMPAHSGDLSDPAGWQHPPVPESWWETIRATMPPYDPDLTPVREVGMIPETFRKQREVRRSGHPQVSFAARGAEAKWVTDGHTLDWGLGDGSPLARLYDLGGRVLLLGVGHECNTSLHLAEYRASYPGRQVVETRVPILCGRQREWVKIQDIELESGDFCRIGEDFERETRLVRRGQVAAAAALLMPQPALVDYAVHWMERNRR